MMGVNPVFVDTNILIYANNKRSPFHDVARSNLLKLHSRKSSLFINRQVIREFVSTASRSENLGTQAALERIIKFQKFFTVLDETKRTTYQLYNLSQTHTFSGKQVHDANIVATMLAYDIPTLLTHNVKDFDRFKDIITINTLEDN